MFSDFIKKRKQKYINKIIRKVEAKHSIYRSKIININNIEYKIKTILIKNQNEIKTHLETNLFKSYEICYLFPLILNLDLSFLKTKVDIIVCDLNWKVIQLLPNHQSNKKIYFKYTSYVYIFHYNTINVYDIKLNDCIWPF